ncbi:MAG TPA: dTDP-glucose 4,6-dehydratase [Thermodesulfobacteriota bacterium]|nr:dTDP-glucose 4,6-dehydratase [Thermodesulfobacteriota bacterium]
MKTVLVTGGCGFIGSHFTRLLIRRTSWRVVNLDKLTYAGNLESLKDIEESSRYRFVRGDIADRVLVNRLLGEEKPWAVVNFAAETHVDRSILDSTPFLETNVIGVQVLLEASRHYGVERFLQISTDEVYGDADGKEPFREEAPLTPSSPYAASKASADLLCLSYVRTYGMPVLTARSSNNYGPFQFPEKLIPLMIRNALVGEELPVYGDGLQRRDWLYVEDNIEAIFRIVENGKVGSIYNVGAGEDITNREIVHLICRFLAEEAGLNLDTLTSRIQSVPDRPGHDRRYALNIQKLHREIGWSPKVSLEAGLRNTIRWYLDNQDWVKRVTAGEYKTYYESVYTRVWRKV